MANPIKVKAVVSNIQSYGDGVYELLITPESIVPRYKAGQFLHLTVDPYDPAGGFWPESRVFSIANSWGSEYIKIVYSIKGRYTSYMEKTLKVGSEVWLKLPYGDFVIQNVLEKYEHVVLIAGGTGISPFLPFLEQQIKDNTLKNKVHLFYGVRKNTHIIAIDVLNNSVKAGVKTQVFTELEEPRKDVLFNISKGRLDIKSITDKVEIEKPVYFLSGPPIMIANFKEYMISNGISNERICIDEWE